MHRNQASGWKRRTTPNKDQRANGVRLRLSRSPNYPLGEAGDWARGGVGEGQR